MREPSPVAVMRQDMAERQRTEAEAQRRAEMLEAVGDVSRLVVAGGDLQTTLDTLARKISHVTGFDGVGIGLYDAEKEQLVFRAYALSPVVEQAGEKRTSLVTHPADSPALRQMLRDKQPILFPDPKIDPRIRGPIQQLAREADINFSATYPLLFGDEFIGRLDLWSIPPRQLSPDDHNFFVALANQTATVVQNARLLLTLERRVEARTRELTTLYAVSAAISQAHDLGAILSESLRKTVEALRCETGAVLLAEPLPEPVPSVSEEADQPARLRLAVYCGAGRDTGAALLTLAADSALCNRMLAQHEPLLIPELDLDLQSPPPLRALGARTWLSAAMRAGGQTLGLLALIRPSTPSFNAAEVALLASIANHLGGAIQHDRLRQRAEQAAVVEERQRLARDLHDSIAQSLYSISLFAQAGLDSVHRKALRQCRHYLTRLGETAQQALKEMRLMIFELREPEAGQDDLAGALEKRLDTVERRAGVECELCADDLRPVPVAVQAELYHIAQEALNNMLKHSAATRVTLAIQYRDGALVMRVEDNGQGFDPASIGEGGLGLANMRERAARLGGQCEIVSAPGQGTTVQVRARINADSDEAEPGRKPDEQKDSGAHRG